MLEILYLFFAVQFFFKRFFQESNQSMQLHLQACADQESFFSEGGGGPTLTFLIDEGKEDPNTTISGPSSARQRNVI